MEFLLKDLVAVLRGGLEEVSSTGCYVDLALKDEGHRGVKLILIKSLAGVRTGGESGLKLLELVCAMDKWLWCQGHSEGDTQSSNSLGLNPEAHFHPGLGQGTSPAHCWLLNFSRHEFSSSQHASSSYPSNDADFELGVNPFLHSESTWSRRIPKMKLLAQVWSIQHKMDLDTEIDSGMVSLPNIVQSQRLSKL
ncbi:hypothetical protein P7K49_036348 [Saguinus oedipus]|uniref:Uncharacterized protein n=1 Tax=Saguinus oedipus TaxID=9490 RepID=A0ABQ9TJZ6_SAGOE|nr:hypothetical protein P7K49_036348 [Saguinus oedipus]